MRISKLSFSENEITKLLEKLSPEKLMEILVKRMK